MGTINSWCGDKPISVIHKHGDIQAPPLTRRQFVFISGRGSDIEV